MSTRIPLYQVDAFSKVLFAGNPAAVCPTDTWLSDDVMQNLAAENNLSETAFVVPDATGEADYGLRWFTPKVEMDLCGHATLATAWVLFNERGLNQDVLTFSTQKVGQLTVSRGADGLISMDFPASKPTPALHPDALVHILGGPALDYCSAPNGMKLAVVGSAEILENLKPNFAAVMQLGGQGLIVTAKGDVGSGHDFVSRYFAPQVGVNEDPVTGSAHTVLAPYWARRLKKESFCARQLSQRGGDVFCRLAGDRVHVAGHGVLYLKGEARIPAA